MEKCSKSLMALYILEILKKYTSADIKFTQSDIAEKLMIDYGIKADRKAIRRNLSKLLEAGYDIRYNEKPRSSDNEEDECVAYTDWYYHGNFERSEIRLLNDCLMSLKGLPESRRKDISDKLLAMIGCHKPSEMKGIRNALDSSYNNKNLIYSLDAIMNALNNDERLSFNYMTFGTDKKLHPRLDKNGVPKLYTVIPRQLAVVSSKYYLICESDDHEGIVHYRVDRMKDVRSAEKVNKKKKLPTAIDYPSHIAEHIYMFSGKSVKVVFTADRSIINDIMDWFGSSVTFLGEDEATVKASVMVNMQAMRFWAMQYGTKVTVTYPKELVQLIKEDIKAAAERYCL